VISRRFKSIAEPLPDRTCCLTECIKDAARKVHGICGPYLTKEAYEAYLIQELKNNGLNAQAHMTFPVYYKSIHLEPGLHVLIMVEDEVIVQAYAAEKILPLHKAILGSYLKIADKNAGIIINFKEQEIENGIFEIAR
jgi:GxxExxY protein